MNKDVDAFVARSAKWPDEMAAMRPVLVDCGLTEELKWRQPCYTHDGRNIVIMTEMKDALTLGFFKGELLDDPDGVLEDNGPNSRSVRRMRFRSVDDVDRLADTVRELVASAIDVERSGRSVEPAPEPTLAAELQERLDADPELAEAFAALTPGRRREYNIFVSGAKQSSTRASRVEKHVERIKAGKGMRDR